MALQMQTFQDPLYSRLLLDDGYAVLVEKVCLVVALEKTVGSPATFLTVFPPTGSPCTCQDHLSHSV